MRIAAAIAVAGALVLGGCSSFDPIDTFQDWDLLGSSKKPLQGDRRPVFPEGVPGVPQGVPQDMVKGYQAPPDAPPPVVEAPRPQKAKKTASAPQPRRAAPKRQQQPPQEEQVEQEEQPMQQAPAARTQRVQGQQGGVQQMPGSQPTWPTNAQPAPQR